MIELGEKECDCGEIHEFILKVETEAGVKCEIMAHDGLEIATECKCGRTIIFDS